jgi:hypothetical protein
MKESVNILCLYWVGEFRGRDFSMNDVERLYRSVLKHIDRPFTFYCLTNTSEEFPEYIKPIPLIYAWPGWWSKMEIHRPDLPPGRTLYMDLDSHVMRSLGPVLNFKGDLVMFDTQIPKTKWQWLKRDKWVCRYQAATMLFTPGTEVMANTWRRFLLSPKQYMNQYRSDQDIMGDWIPNQPTFPASWMSKLDYIRRNPILPNDCIIVTGQTRDGLFRNTKLIPWFEETAR